MPKEYNVYLNDILKSIERIEKYTKNNSVKKIIKELGQSEKKPVKKCL